MVFWLGNVVVRGRFEGVFCSMLCECSGIWVFFRPVL